MARFDTYDVMCTFPYLKININQGCVYLLGLIILGMKLSDSSLDMLKVSLRLSKLFEIFSFLMLMFWWWMVLVTVCLWRMVKAGLR